MDSRYKSEKRVTFSVRKNVTKPAQLRVSAKVQFPKKTGSDKVCCNALAKSNTQSLQIHNEVKHLVKPKKRLVRYVEENVDSKKVTVVQLPEIPSTLDLPSNLGDSGDTVQFVEDKCKYDKPELYSSLTIAKKLQQVGRDAGIVKSVPRSTQQGIVEQAGAMAATSGVDFDQEERLYRDLVSLAIDEAALVRDEARRRLAHTRPRKHDVQPRLSDFYRPSFCGEYAVPCRSKLPAVDRVKRFDGFSLYEQCQVWKQV